VAFLAALRRVLRLRLLLHLLTKMPPLAWDLVLYRLLLALALPNLGMCLALQARRGLLRARRDLLLRREVHQEEQPPEAHLLQQKLLELACPALTQAQEH
jgi:hypothetical protein